MSTKYFRVPAFRPLSIFLLVCLALTPLLASAQDEPPAPQFLYRDDNHILLVNGYTGEANPLPFEVGKDDRFEWSPDGKYVLAHLQENSEIDLVCINLYDVDKWEWISKQPVSCSVQGTAFSADGTQLAYIVAPSKENFNGSVWLYSPSERTREKIYQTTGGEELREDGISDVRWSPSNDYLTFMKYHAIMGGTLNEFVIFNASTQESVTLQAPDTYYASYNPIWSPDDSWFLIVLQDEYVSSGTAPITNHKGDLYLVNTATAEHYRITYTPAYYETHIHWTDEGNIAFTELIEQDMTFTPEQAMKVEPVPQDQIIMPEMFDLQAFQQEATKGLGFISPDDMVSAWVDSVPNASGSRDYQLNIGEAIYPNDTVFTGHIPATYQEDRVLIGWRPSQYHYPVG